MASIKELSIIIVLFGSLAFAGKVNLDARTEFESYSTNTALGRPAYSVFKVNRLKLDFQGTLGEMNSYRVRIDPLKVDSKTTKNTRDGVSSYLDIGFINRKIDDQWNLSMGKIVTGMGGAEAMNNTGDIYLRSTAGDQVALVYWPVGMQIQRVFGDQKLNVNVSNITEDVTDSATSPNLSSTSHMYGITYLGKLSDGNILPSVSYHSEDFRNTGTRKVTRNYVAVGAKFLISDFEVEVDALNNTGKYDAQAAKDIIDTLSSVLLARYKMESGSVHLKYEGTTQKTAIDVTNSSSTTITGTTLAYEFKPLKEEYWRAHVALTQKDTKPESADTQSEKRVLVGMRILADFLK